MNRYAIEFPWTSANSLYSFTICSSSLCFTFTVFLEPPSYMHPVQNFPSVPAKIHPLCSLVGADMVEWWAVSNSQKLDCLCWKSVTIVVRCNTFCNCNINNKVTLVEQESRQLQILSESVFETETCSKQSIDLYQ